MQHRRPPEGGCVIPRPWLGEIAYHAYCLSLGQVPAWESLSWAERFAWGAGVQAALLASQDLTILPPRQAATAYERRCHEAYVLAVLYRRPVGEVCASLRISRRTLYRYLARERQAA